MIVSESMKKNFLQHKQKILIATILITAAAVGLFLDFKYTTLGQKTLFDRIGDQAYPQVIRPEDRVPITIAKNSKTLLLPILMYHHIGYPPKDASPVRLGLTVSPEDFAAQAKWISSQGFQTVSLQQFYDYSQGKAVPWPKKPIIFTFDDGYQDAFDNAIPVLKQYGFMGSFAIITNYPSQKQGDNFYASWERIAQAKQDGMEIICHTQNHFDGKDPKYSAGYIYENLSGCQQDLQSHLGATEPFLIYPYGAYTPAYLEQAKRAGFVLGLTIHYGKELDLENLMELPRVRINGGETLDSVIKKLSDEKTVKIPETKSATSTKP